MKQFRLFFTADNLPYHTTIPAQTDGQAQDNFAKWFTEIFKPQRGILGVVTVTKIEVDRTEDNVYKTFKEWANIWK